MRLHAERYTQFKKYFSRGEKEIIGFQKGINLIFSLFNKGENMVFSSALLQKTIYLKRQNLYNYYNF